MLVFVVEERQIELLPSVDAVEPRVSTYKLGRLSFSSSIIFLTNSSFSSIFFVSFSS